MQVLSFGRPADFWEECWPIGNGRLGAMIAGKITEDEVQLNEDSFWYGGFRDRVNPDAKKVLPEIRNLIRNGEVCEAQEKMKMFLSGVPESQYPYQTAGNLAFSFKGIEGSIENYDRNLDLQNGIVRISFRQNGKKYDREYLASYPQQILAFRFVTDAPEGLNFTLRLNRGRMYDFSGAKEENTIFIGGTLGKGGNDYLEAAKVVLKKGGESSAAGDTLIVKEAKEVEIYVAIETSFYHGKNYHENAFGRVEEAAKVGYERIKEEHEKDVSSLMKRMSLQLLEESEKPLSSEALLRKAAEGDEEASKRLTELYFQYGRYLLASSSRPGSQPANLQGIWNKEFFPSWDSKYTININTQMNYWPAENCALGECHQPLFELLRRMHDKGKKVAEEMYGCRGFVAHHNTDIWGDCAPQDIYIPATYWVMGAAWLCTHVWNHYLYGGDIRFLKEMYPVVEDAILFFLDFMTEENGVLLTCPSVSPENSYRLENGQVASVCMGASMDIEILRELTEQYLKMVQVLDVDNEVSQKVRRMMKKLPPIRVGSKGQILEWQKEYEEMEPGHRHMSHLYALYPGNQITVDETPELARAAEYTLSQRILYGGGHTGWSCAWIIAFWARLGRGEKALENLMKLWRESTFPNFMDKHPWDTHGVFQIDGNLGATAAICEMLVSANEKRVCLLHALPPAWQSGKVAGICIPGGGEADIIWENGTLVKCTIHAKKDIKTMVVWESKKMKVQIAAGEQFCFTPTDFYNRGNDI